MEKEELERRLPTQLTFMSQEQMNDYNWLDVSVNLEGYHFTKKLFIDQLNQFSA